MMGTEQEAVVVIFREGASEVLRQNQGSCLLPRLRFVDQHSSTRGVARVIRQSLGISIVVLDWFRCASGAWVCLALQDRVHEPLPVAFSWAERSQSRQRLDADDQPILDQAMRHQSSLDANQERPLARTDALAELRAWYGPILHERRGREIEVEHWQLGAQSTLLRLSTDGGAAWLKVVGSEYWMEPTISQALSNLFPEDIPPVYATHAKWNAMLIADVDGPTLNQVHRKAAWLKTAHRLAELQLQCIGRDEELLRSGCAPWGGPEILDRVPDFFEAMIAVMAQQQPGRAPALRQEELRSLSSEAERVCASLADLAIPDTLTHGNFSPHNVIWHAERPVFLDWAFAMVGIPFLSEEYFRHRMVREHPAYESWAADLQGAYYEPWREKLGERTIARAMALTKSLAPLSAAMNLERQQPGGWRTIPQRAAVLRSLVRRFAFEVKSTPKTVQTAPVVNYATA